MILAIDPGDVLSAWVLFDPVEHKLIDFAKEPNHDLLARLPELRKQTDIEVLEMIASYGMAVGKTVFETCVWIGRYWEAWKHLGGNVDRVFRKDVKMSVCHSMRATDSNIRVALIDMFPRTGKNTKGEPCAKGCKKYPGPLYGVSKDVWAALGVAVTYAKALKT
jgi:hypothetical protein